MEYSFRSLDPRDVRGDDINFYLTGLKVDNSAEVRKAYSISQSMVYNGVKNGILYRQAIMRKPPNNGVGYIIDLADIIIPGGVLRVDRTRLAFEHELTLGHFGLPHIQGQKATVNSFSDGNKKVITAAIKGRRVALITYAGWDEVESMVHENRNAEAQESTVIYAHKKRLAKNPAMELMITVMLHKTDDSEWSADELSPVRNIEIMDVTPVFSAMGAKITMADNTLYEVYFEEIDGNRRC